MVDLAFILQVTIMGLAFGAIYSLVSIGINMTYGVMKLINWAQGAFFMIGGYFQYYIIIGLIGRDFWWLAIPFAGIITGLVGVVCQILLLGDIVWEGEVKRRVDYATLVTIGISITFTYSAMLLAGPFTHTPGDYIAVVFLGDIPLSGNRIVALGGSILVMFLLYIFLTRTWTGKALMATAQNRVMAQVAGVRTQRMDTLAFFLSSGLAGLAGALLAPVYWVYPTAGNGVLIKGYIVIIIGGIGSLIGSVVAGFGLGLVEAFGAMFLDPGYQPLYGLLLLIIVLLSKPTGLFGEKERQV
ncbi:MAG: branched-chain amino acid ABC transporter permease [Candidatus Thorarchaeota archaeon]